MLNIFLTVLILIASVLLIGVVLIQKSKGGGLASNFQGANQVMGVRSANNFVEKATWTLALVICVLSILSAFVAPRSLVTSSKIKAQAPTEQTSTAFPTEKTAPAAQKTAPTAPAQGTPAPAAPAK